MNKRKTVAICAGSFLAVVATIWSARGVIVSAAAAQDPAQDKPAEKKAAPKGMPDLVKGLKDTPGCLGVETARTQSGKNLIFAWFENKQAVLSWYKSKTHAFYLDMMGGGGRPPLAHVPDDGKPILCIASITPSKDPKVEGAPMPVSQISIELYSVLPGGASVGGTFAPESLKIPNHAKYDEEKPKAGDEPKAKPEG